MVIIIFSRITFSTAPKTSIYLHFHKEGHSVIRYKRSFLFRNHFGKLKVYFSTNIHLGCNLLGDVEHTTNYLIHSVDLGNLRGEIDKFDKSCSRNIFLIFAYFFTWFFYGMLKQQWDVWRFFINSQKHLIGDSEVSKTSREHCVPKPCFTCGNILICIYVKHFLSKWLTPCPDHSIYIFYHHLFISTSKSKY